MDTLKIIELAIQRIYYLSELIGFLLDEFEQTVTLKKIHKSDRFGLTAAAIKWREYRLERLISSFQFEFVSKVMAVLKVRHLIPSDSLLKIEVNKVVERFCTLSENGNYTISLNL